VVTDTMSKEVEFCAVVTKLRELARKSRRLAREMPAGREQSRLLEFAAELEERALRIETAPTSDTSH
jgi:hypothetical protein